MDDILLHYINNFCTGSLNVGIHDFVTPNDASTDSIIDEIIHELGECREDERNSQNQMLQVISVAGGLIGACFAVSTFLVDRNSTLEFNDSINRFSLIMTNCVFCTAFLYVVFLGINNVLRYHYILSLDDQLTRIIYKNNNQNALLHWMDFSSPILTKNPSHLTTKYAVLSYLTYAVATVSAGIFGIVTVFMEFAAIYSKKWFDIFLTILPIFIIMFSLTSFIAVSRHAEDMFNTSMKKALEKKKRRFMENNENNNTFSLADKMRAAAYYIYPKSKDFQKMFLIPIGSIYGIFMSDGINFTKENLFHILFGIIVIDILIYQSRYQWNDIRGFEDDCKSGRKRLPIHILGEEKAIQLSLISIICKIFLAFSICIINKEYSLLICSLFIIFSAILYEWARSCKKNRCILFLVGLGYMIRFFSGLWIIIPIENMNWFYVYIIVAYGLCGCFSASLPWTHEAILEKRNMKALKNKEFSKSYLKFLYDTIENRENEIPALLKAKGSIRDPWNMSYLGSMSCLIFAVLALKPQCGYIIIEIVCLLVLAVSLCKNSEIGVRKHWWIAIGVVILKVLLLTNFSEPRQYICIFITQILFTTVYYFLRFRFDPQFDFFKSAYILVVGQQTNEYLDKIKTGK